MFRRACEEHEEGPEKQLLTDICRLYGLWQIEEQGASFLKCESREEVISYLLDTDVALCGLETRTLTANRWTLFKLRWMNCVYP